MRWGALPRKERSQDANDDTPRRVRLRVAHMSALPGTPPDPLAHASPDTLLALDAIRANPDRLTPLLAANPDLKCRLDLISASGLFCRPEVVPAAERTCVTVLLAALHEHLNVDPLPEIDSARLWEQLLRRTAAAALICEYRPEQCESLVTFTLAQEIALIELLRRHADQLPAGYWSDLTRADPADRGGLERQVLGVSREECGAELLCGLQYAGHRATVGSPVAVRPVTGFGWNPEVIVARLSSTTTSSSPRLHDALQIAGIAV